MKRQALSLLSTTALLTAGCQAPTLSTGLAPRLTLDAHAAVAALAHKESGTWQDATLAPLTRHQQGRYRTLAAAAAGWSVKLPANSSATPAIRYGSTPSLYVATDNPAGTPQLFQLSAADGKGIKAWDVLAGIPGVGTINSSSVVLSADAKRVYLATSGGFFLVLNADTGQLLFALKLSLSGFAHTSPFIDYSNGGGRPLGSNENVYLVSNDGSLYRVNVTPTSCDAYAWVSNMGVDRPLWTISPVISYGQAVTVNAPPIVWKGKAYFGDTAGRCHRVDVSTGTPVLTTWRPDQGTSALSAAITAPVTLDFDGAFDVNQIFVPCGDRLAWIDPNRPIIEDAVVVSPPLLVDKSTHLQGRLSSYPYTTPVVKGPYDCLDFVSAASLAEPAPSRWGNGTGDDGRLMGAAGYTSPTDGNGSRGYMQFELPVGDFGGGVPVSAHIELSAANTPSTSETIQLFRASNFHKGTNGFWTGMNYFPDVDWHNRPNLLSEAIGSYTGPVSASDPASGLPRYSIPFSDPMPGDRPNIDDTYVWHAYTMVSQGKQRSTSPKTAGTAAARWHRGIAGDAATEPKLYVTLDTAAKTPVDHGLRGQATIDPNGRRIWVMGSNALFELSYASRAAFQAKANTTYTMSAAGRATDGASGPTSGGTYVLPVSNVMFTGERLLALDADPVNNRCFVNNFKMPLSSTVDQLSTYYDVGAGAGPACSQMLYDFAGKGAFLTTRNGRLVRVSIN